MVQADAFGIPIGQVLRVQSNEMRVKRRQRAEEKAQKVPVKILFPLMFCILPTLFIAVIGPGVISMMDSFMGRYRLSHGSCQHDEVFCRSGDTRADAGSEPGAPKDRPDGRRRVAKLGRHPMRAAAAARPHRHRCTSVLSARRLHARDAEQHRRSSPPAPWSC